MFLCWTEKLMEGMIDVVAFNGRGKILPVVILIAVICAAALIYSKPKATVGKSKGQIVIKIWDHLIAQQKVYDEQFEKFMKENPDIKIEHSVFNVGQYANVVQLAFKGNTAPDLLYLPVSVYQVADEWLRPLTPYIDKKWLQQFPPNGCVTVNGEVYSFPIASRSTTLVQPLFWNRRLFAKAGLDSPPATWDEFREYAKKITAVGNGKFYGFILGGQNDFIWERNVGFLAALAGAPGRDTGMDYKKGEYNYLQPGYEEAFKLLYALNEDKSIFPGIMSLNDEQARAYFATDRAAMIIGGTWNISGWKKYPNADYGVAPLPVPNQGALSKPVYQATAGGSWFLSNQCKNPDAAWRILKFISSIEFGEAIVEGDLGMSIHPEANKLLKNPRLKEVIDVINEQMLIGPAPELRNPETVYLDEYRAKVPSIKYSFAKAIQDSWTGGVPVTETFKKATEEANRVFRAAIELARKNGRKISLADYRFPDFNPLADYYK